jgi:hypothetical protein
MLDMDMDKVTSSHMLDLANLNSFLLLTSHGAKMTQTDFQFRSCGIRMKRLGVYLAHVNPWADYLHRSKKLLGWRYTSVVIGQSNPSEFIAVSVLHEV